MLSRVVLIIFWALKLCMSLCFDILTPDIERTTLVLDFVVKRDVNGVQETRRLACQWVLSEGKLTKHYTGDGQVKCCFHVTEWMLSFLDTIKTEAGARYVRNPFGKSVAEATGKARDTRKQKTAPLLSGGNFIVTAAHGQDS